jgi:hypothetical protein
MQRREWSVPACETPQRGHASDASGQSRPWSVVEYVVHFIFFMMFFGVVGYLWSSWFPIALGLFLFFTNDEFIEWTLHKVGIRLVPDTLGPEFIKAFRIFVRVVDLARILEGIRA